MILSYTFLLQSTLPKRFIDRFVHMLANLIDTEAGPALARRILSEGFQEGRSLHCSNAGEIGILDEPVIVLIRRDIGALVRVHSQVKELREPQRSERIRPDQQIPGSALFLEDNLKVTETRGHQVSIIVEIKEIIACAL